jgi:hypothetical protein
MAAQPLPPGSEQKIVSEARLSLVLAAPKFMVTLPLGGVVSTTTALLPDKDHNPLLSFS